MKHTIALNMIVGPNDGKLLYRCLTALDYGGLFDEIVIGKTVEGDKDVDENLEELARMFGRRFKVFPVKWEQDFAKARNAVLSVTESDFVMWMDCDDVLVETNPGAFAELKEIISQGKYNVYRMEYWLEGGNRVFTRERIFKRENTLWEFPLHEYARGDNFHIHAKLAGLHMDHRPEKSPDVSINRNIAIIENYLQYNKNPIMETHLVREYMAKSRVFRNNPEIRKTWNKALDMADRLIEDRNLSPDAVAELILLRTMDTLYSIDSYLELTPDKEDIPEMATLVRIGYSVYPSMAEWTTMMGDIYFLHYGEIDKAINMYEESLQKEITGGGTHFSIFYRWIPHARLAEAYAVKKEYELALYHNRKTLECAKTYQLAENRKKLVNEINLQFEIDMKEKYSNLCKG